MTESPSFGSEQPDTTRDDDASVLNPDAGTSGDTNTPAPPDERPWQVVSRGNMLLFAGTEEDARKYVQDNFPRVHVQPGSVAEPEADATLVNPDGGRSQWLTTDWKDVEG